MKKLVNLQEILTVFQLFLRIDKFLLNYFIIQLGDYKWQENISKRAMHNKCHVKITCTQNFNFLFAVDFSCIFSTGLCLAFMISPGILSVSCFVGVLLTPTGAIPGSPW